MPLYFFRVIEAFDIHAFPILPALNSVTIEVVSDSISANLGTIIHLRAPYPLLRLPTLVEIHTKGLRARFLGLGARFFIVKL